MAYKLHFELDDDINTSLDKSTFYFKEWDKVKILAKLDEIEKSLSPRKPAFSIIVDGKNLTEGDDDWYFKEFKQTLRFCKRYVKASKAKNQLGVSRGGNRYISIEEYHIPKEIEWE